MPTSPQTGGSSSSALTFEQFVDVALGAAIKAAQRHGGTPPGGSAGKKPGGGVHLPFPIWVGIVIGPFNQGTNLDASAQNE